MQFVNAKLHNNTERKDANQNATTAYYALCVCESLCVFVNKHKDGNVNAPTANWQQQE